MEHPTTVLSLHRRLQIVLGLFAMLLGNVAAEAQTAATTPCVDCVEDVVIETDDGRWLGGYISWNRPPFRYLDLRHPGDRLRLQRHGKVNDTVRLWTSAVAMGRDRWPADLGDPPPLPPPPPGSTRSAMEVALLIGPGQALPLASVRRIFPRIGSGLPAVEVSTTQLVALAEEYLPFLSPQHGECLGCPMTAEDVTLVLTSGEILGGVTTWHGAEGLQGYDARQGSELPAAGWGFRRMLDEGFVLWPQAISAPRRRFHSDASMDFNGNLVVARGFQQVSSTVLLLGMPRRLESQDVAFFLPGPSRAFYPLQTTRKIAERLLLETPAVAMESHWDLAYVSCFGYGETTLERLAKVCSARQIETPEFIAAMSQPGIGLLQSPFWKPEVPVSDVLPEIVVLAFDGGT